MHQEHFPPLSSASAFGPPRSYSYSAYFTLIMPPKVVKCKRVNLNVTQKLELIRKLKKGKTVAQMCDEYGIKKQTMSDIRKVKDKWRNYAANFCVDVLANKSKDGPQKHMKMGKDTQLDAAVMKWYVQQTPWPFYC